MSIQKRLKHVDLIQEGNFLQVTVCINNLIYEYYSGFIATTGPEYTIRDAAIFQVRVITSQTEEEFNNLIFIKFVKLRKDDDETYKINFTSRVLEIQDKWFTSDDGTWRLVYECDGSEFTFDIKVCMDIVSSPTSFAILHEDMELTDFKLRGDDGSVHVHRAVLAASSPVFRRMLKGAWLETSEGYVDVSGTSELTLQHLKNYIYLHTLPDEGLYHLLLLSSCYMMPDLEDKCVDKLVSNLTAETACDLLEFAAKHKMSKLLMAILKCVRNDVVDLKDIQDYLLRAC